MPAPPGPAPGPAPGRLRERTGTVSAVARPAWHAAAGFLLLLAAVFAGSYAAGAAAGPVAPGLHSPDAPGRGTGQGHGGGGH
ncbi:hypothetical protein [Streptomyces sp. JJ38]|uniref:hypothetical protein n=1 Tax=Streptomyces sp. JJ38 TaxID=2738128 RepID=UPI001C568755|nr:hypothetical protein [Streptomyces sp. JJ38]MBW1597473.1 hypothetical protein [Streptomyces sp. JJ38]